MQWKANQHSGGKATREAPLPDGWPPVKQRAPFVGGCVPVDSDSSHDKNRVRCLQRQVNAKGPSKAKPSQMVTLFLIASNGTHARMQD